MYDIFFVNFRVIIVAVWSHFTGRADVQCGHGLSRHFDLYGLGG